MVGLSNLIEKMEMNKKDGVFSEGSYILSLK
jgi:hypothetical protein